MHAGHWEQCLGGQDIGQPQVVDYILLGLHHASVVFDAAVPKLAWKERAVEDSQRITGDEDADKGVMGRGLTALSIGDAGQTAGKTGLRTQRNLLDKGTPRSQAFPTGPNG